MDCDFRTSLGVAVVILASLLSGGCQGGTATSSATDGSSTSTTSSSTGATSPGDPSSGVVTTGDPTTGTATTATTGEPTTSSSTSGGVEGCTTLLCGSLSLCCVPGEACVGNACLPVCDSGIRCGADDSLCCAAGEVCLGDACAIPLGPCQGPADCPDAQFCDPVLEACLPAPNPLGCDLVPDTLELAPLWAWTADQVASTPMVADVDADGVPDVVVSTTLGGPTAEFWPVGEIVVLDGATGEEKWRIAHDPANQRYGSHGRATIAVGDVSGDAVPDIIYAGREDVLRRSPVHAVDGQGNLLWTSRLPNNVEARLRIENGAPALANLDGDPEAEVVFGAAILDHDGLLVWNQDGNGAMFGTPLNNGQPIYSGGLATLADLDGDGKPEIVTGREAWKITWIDGDPPQVTLSLLWANASNPVPSHNNDGWPAVADLDGDGDPEVVLTAWPAIRVIDGQTGELWCGVDPTGAACETDPSLRTKPIAIQGGNLGGPPTIADFDGDGRPEVAIAGGLAVAVYDFARPGEEIVQPMALPPPAPGAMYVRWYAPIVDNSSAATGSQAFDFWGDGAAEVVLQDECFTRVFDGATGEVLLELMNSTSTIHEYPIVVDVDGDGASELLTVANLSIPSSLDGCLAKTPNYLARQGVFAYRPQGTPWAKTRPLWTQYSYHVTNADDAGNPPLVEKDNWTVPGLNNFREGPAEAMIVGAPDLTLSLAGDLAQCPAELVLVATIHNGGTSGVPAGIEVAFYEGADMKGTLLGTAQTSEGIVPGGSTQVTWTVPGPPADMPIAFFAVVDDGASGGAVTECEEGNNTALLLKAACP